MASLIGMLVPRRTFHNKELSLFSSNVSIITTSLLIMLLDLSFFLDSTQFRSRYIFHYWTEWNNIQHFMGSSTNGEEQWDSRSLWSKCRVGSHERTLTASSCKQQRSQYNKNLCCFVWFPYLFPVQYLCSGFYCRRTWALWSGHTATDIK